MNDKNQTKENKKMLEELLFDKNLKCSGLERKIDWSLFREKELKNLIINYPDQILMRFHLLENNFIKNKFYLTEILRFYSLRSCSTFYTMVSKFGGIFAEKIILELFLLRLTKTNDSYHLLSEVKNILENCKISKKIRDLLEIQKKFLNEQEKIRKSSSYSYSGGIH